MPIGTLGEVVFEVTDNHIRTFSGFTYNVSAKYQTHNRIGRRPITEFTGLDAEKITLNIKLAYHLGTDPRSEMRVLNDMCRSGEAQRLYIGNQKFGRYKWVISKVQTKLQRIDNRGRILSADCSLTLTEYARR